MPSSRSATAHSEAGLPRGRQMRLSPPPGWTTRCAARPGRRHGAAAPGLSRTGDLSRGGRVLLCPPAGSGGGGLWCPIDRSRCHPSAETPSCINRRPNVPHQPKEQTTPGAPGQSRTGDLSLRRRLLYPLSYWGGTCGPTCEDSGTPIRSLVSVTPGLRSGRDRGLLGRVTAPSWTQVHKARP